MLVTNALMVAFGFTLSYHVMRTAAAAGIRVHVLGSGPSRGLRASRHCASYRTSSLAGNDDQDHDALLEEIAEAVRQHRIDLVFRADDVSTRLLVAVRDRLPVASSLLPDLATFELLNDKARFTRFALDHHIRAPQFWLYDEAGAVRRDLLGGGLELPVTVKPTNQSGGTGVVHIRNKAEIENLKVVDYRPVLVQRHIFGPTIGMS